VNSGNSHNIPSSSLTSPRPNSASSPQSTPLSTSRCDTHHQARPKLSSTTPWTSGIAGPPDTGQSCDPCVIFEGPTSPRSPPGNIPSRSHQCSAIESKDVELLVNSMCAPPKYATVDEQPFVAFASFRECRSIEAPATTASIDWTDRIPDRFAAIAPFGTGLTVRTTTVDGWVTNEALSPPGVGFDLMRPRVEHCDQTSPCDQITRSLQTVMVDGFPASTRTAPLRCWNRRVEEPSSGRCRPGHRPRRATHFAPR
jgi:hypothetical protein